MIVHCMLMITAWTENRPPLVQTSGVLRNSKVVIVGVTFTSESKMHNAGAVCDVERISSVCIFEAAESAVR